jgi:hypothetical protein
MKLASARAAALVVALSALGTLGTLGTVSCATPLLKLPPLPEGPGGRAVDGAEVVAEATTICRGIRTMTAEMSVSGSIGGRPIPRGRLIAALAEPDAVHLDAVAPFGESIFMFVVKDGRATLLLPRDDRALENGAPAAVLEAVTGVPLDGASLRLALTGCADASGGAEMLSVGDRWRILTVGESAQYFERDGRTGAWRMVAALHAMTDRPTWRAEYRGFLNGLPRSIRFVSPAPGRFDLRLALSDVEINTPVPNEAFELRIPPGTNPIGLEELRRSGPLAAPGNPDAR